MRAKNEDLKNEHRPCRRLLNREIATLETMTHARSLPITTVQKRARQRFPLRLKTSGATPNNLHILGLSSLVS